MGLEEPPLALPDAERGWGARSMSAMDLVAFGCGRLRPQGGDRRRGTARRLRAAEMRLKTSGSDAGGLAADKGGGGVALQGEGGGAGGRRSPTAQEVPLAGRHQDGRLLAPARSCLRLLEGGEKKSASPPSGCAATLTALPWSSGRSGLGRFRDLESPDPRAEGGRALAHGHGCLGGTNPPLALCKAMGTCDCCDCMCRGC